MSSSSLFASLGASLQGFSSPRFSFRASNSSPNVEPQLAVFESELNAGLQQLNICDDSGYLSIAWLCRAMKMVLCTHASAQVFAADFRAALLHGDNKLIDECLDRSVTLLDICLTLKEAIAEIKEYCTDVKIALRALEKGNIGEIQLKRCVRALKICMEALKRRDEVVNYVGQRRSKLENCSSMLRRMGERLNADDAVKGSFFKVMYGAQVCTIFVCGLLSSALSFKPRRSLSSMCIIAQSPWSFTLSGLQQRMKDQIEKKKSKGATAFLEELEKTDIGVQDLHSRAEKMLDNNSFPLRKGKIMEVRESAKLLRASCVELQEGIIPLQSLLEEIYRNLLQSRMALLDMHAVS